MSREPDLTRVNEVASRMNHGPVWKGPEEDGITFSLLSRFLACRERFRLLVVEGLKPRSHFNHRLEFGNLWHICEEEYARGNDHEIPLRAYAMSLCQEYPTQQEQIDHWYRVVRVQFPVYLDYWSRNPDQVDRKNILSEATFRIPYTLPSGRRVILRGKWDSLDEINGRVYLQENKTKSDIYQERIVRQLTFDLQTMIYLVALESTEFDEGMNIGGVRYNVVRRPLSGGKYSITRHKPTKKNPDGESKKSFYSRLQGLIESDPQHFFMRWKVEVSQQEIHRFKTQCLNPILEQLCDWWEYLKAHDRIYDSYSDVWSYNKGIHWRHPYGVYNPLDEGGSSELDNYLDTGSEMGLQRTTNLFPEL